MLTPKKGIAPPTGKLKPTRAERLMTATQDLAADQLPDAHTMTAIEGATAPTAMASDDGPTSTDTAAADTDAIRRVPVDAVRPSPFQPRGRPSATAVDAVRAAAVAAGSLAALVAPDGALAFGRLAPEAARLAELAADVAEHGVTVPIEVRIAEDGARECLSGHRRLAAARLAGLDTIPVIERGAMSNAAAAATVLRGNLHRENFTTWQEAVLVSEVQERRRYDGFPDNVRSLAPVMGWSHGKVNMLLRIRRALAPEVLDDVATRTSAPVAHLEEQLARAAYRDLERVAGEPDASLRAAQLQRLLGFAPAAAPGAAARDRLVCTHRPKRGGGFLLEVNAPVEALAPSDASHLRELLEAQLARVNARLAALGGPAA